MEGGGNGAPAGLRARKKALTRRTLSDVATGLFLERGFDAVTIADVAEAAGVSAKTVFNYFGSKEELFFDREAAIHDALVAAVTGRAAGATVTGALATLLAERPAPDDPGGWAALRRPGRLEAVRAFLAAWRGSPALRGRALIGAERLAERLHEALAAEAGLPGGDDRTRTMAALLAAAVVLRQRAYADAVLEGLPARGVERRVREVTAEALGRVAAAFPDLDRPRGASPGT